MKSYDTPSPVWVVKVLWPSGGGKSSSAARRFLFTEKDLRQEIPLPCGCVQLVECGACLRVETEKSAIPCRHHPDQVATVEIRRLRPGPTVER
ncbi:MAG TPA: hypothetical protein VI643_02565 [Planctomycetota bacterium]|nr:hypothetical protein [Planctomycetota bacterium]